MCPQSITIDLAITPADIMVVDDHLPNVLLLEQMLRRKGHIVRSFTRGWDALEGARMAPPNLILLDINMPELDGYQTCQLFKQEPTLAAIPVIFLSAVSQTAGKVEAFRSGGVDYISKPFEFDEVHARVEIHLKLHLLQQKLRDQNSRLDAMVQARTRELEAANQQLSRLDQAKSDFLHMISHELRTPLNGVLGAADLLMSQVKATPEAIELSEILTDSQQRILSLMDSALLLTEIGMEGGRFQVETLSLGEILAAAAAGANSLATARQVKIRIPRDCVGWTNGNRELLVRAWQALIETAVKFSAAGETVTISGGTGFVLSIDTSSGTIPEPALAQFFDLFGVNESSTVAGHLGLDPAMAGRILALFGGSVAVENRPAGGILIWVRYANGIDLEALDCGWAS